MGAISSQVRGLENGPAYTHLVRPLYEIEITLAILGRTSGKIEEDFLPHFLAPRRCLLRFQRNGQPSNP